MQLSRSVGIIEEQSLGQSLDTKMLGMIGYLAYVVRKGIGVKVE